LERARRLLDIVSVYICKDDWNVEGRQAGSFGTGRALILCMAERILIIDDDEQLASAYKEYLSAQGYQVDCAQELEEAQSLLAHLPYSVVVTDLRLSKLGFGGLDVIRYVRELALNTKIIVFTGYGWPELRAEASAQNVDAFIRKPAQLSALAETVAQLAGAKI
jgi:two-component system, NtrC family, response regulator PilR